VEKSVLQETQHDRTSPVAALFEERRGGRKGNKENVGCVVFKYLPIACWGVLVRGTKETPPLGGLSTKRVTWALCERGKGRWLETLLQRNCAANGEKRRETTSGGYKCLWGEGDKNKKAYMSTEFLDRDWNVRKP